MILGLSRASPQPTLITTLSSFEDLHHAFVLNFFIRAGAISLA